jgi:hypothetical protein
MGHAGAWVGMGEGTAESKSKALADAGVTMVDHPAKLGGVMKDILAKSGRNVKKIVSEVLTNTSHKTDSILGTISISSPTTPLLLHDAPFFSKSPHSHLIPLRAKTIPPHQRIPNYRSPPKIQHHHISLLIPNPQLQPLPRHNSSTIRPLPLHNRRTNNNATPPPRPPLPLRLPSWTYSRSHRLHNIMASNRCRASKSQSPNRRTDPQPLEVICRERSHHRHRVSRHPRR